MLKNTAIIILVIVIIYLYYQNRKFQQLPQTANSDSSNRTIFELDENQEDLITERDQSIRAKKKAEAESLSLSNKLKLKNQEVSRKDTEINRLKGEKSKVEIALNGKIKELREKYSKQGLLLDEEQCENNKLVEKIEKLETKITELEQERTNLLREISKHSDLDEFLTWLNKDEKNKANLPDWDKIISEMKNKISDYHLSENNWASGLLKRNGNYWAVFKDWLDTDYD